MKNGSWVRCEVILYHSLPNNFIQKCCDDSILAQKENSLAEMRKAKCPYNKVSSIIKIVLERCSSVSFPRRVLEMEFPSIFITLFWCSLCLFNDSIVSASLQFPTLKLGHSFDLKHQGLQRPAFPYCSAAQSWHRDRETFNNQPYSLHLKADTLLLLPLEL